jgi:hypothetical protein
MFRRFRGAIFREFSMSLLNCCPMSLNRNGMRVVYCDRRFHGIGQQFSRLILNALKMAPI